MYMFMKTVLKNYLIKNMEDIVVFYCLSDKYSQFLQLYLEQETCKYLLYLSSIVNDQFVANSEDILGIFFYF